MPGKDLALENHESHEKQDQTEVQIVVRPSRGTKKI
jgi:hypothetical protein